MFERGQHERETLKAALRQWEFEQSEPPSYERVRRRVAASPSPLKRQHRTAAQSLRLAVALGRAQLRVVPWLVVPLALLTATFAALVARFFSVTVGPHAAVGGFASLALFGVNLTVTTALSRIRQDAVALTTPLGPSAVVLARVAVVLVLDAATVILGATAAAAWGTADIFGPILAGWLVPMAAVAGTVAFLSIWVAPWVGIVVGLAVSAVVGPSSSPLGLGPYSGSLQEAITPLGVVALGLALIAGAAFSAPRAVASLRDE